MSRNTCIWSVGRFIMSLQNHASKSYRMKRHFSSLTKSLNIKLHNCLLILNAQNLKSNCCLLESIFNFYFIYFLFRSNFNATMVPKGLSPDIHKKNVKFALNCFYRYTVTYFETHFIPTFLKKNRKIVQKI